ncbi:hypothetical protein RYO59_001884 [Thermosynechococcaceae cyanobacterium Okahandja]
MDHLYLQTFGEVATTVAATLPLAEVYRLWQETLPEHIVILDDGLRPVGVVQGWRLALSVTQDASISHLTVGSLLASWRSPVAVLPATWSVPQFQQWAAQQSQLPHFIALVDEQQRFVSLLDQQRLLHYWATQPPLPWVEVFSQFPLPLQIQNRQGEVVWQNSAWLTQLGTVPEIHRPFDGMSCHAVAGPWQLCAVPLHLRPQEVAVLRGEPAVAMTVAPPLTQYWLWFAQALDRPQTPSPHRVSQLRLHQQKRLLLSLGHELKNPLTAVLSLTQLLWQEPLPQQQQDYVALIQRSGWQMNRLLQAWQDYTRALWRELELQWEAVPLAEVWFRAHELAVHLYGSRSPHPSFQWQMDRSFADIELYGDALRLRQMFAHLMGWVAQVGGDRRGTHLCQWRDWLVVQLWEEGGGIPLSYHEQLLHECLEDHAEVSMGLMLAHQLSRLHNGELSFVANAHRSEWSVLLPLASDLSIAVPTATHLILLVSNDAEWLLAVVNALKQENYGYVVARQPLEALDKLEQLHPTVIVVRSATSLALGDVLSVLTGSEQSQNVPIMLISDEVPPVALPGLVRQIPFQSSTALVMDVLGQWCYPRVKAPAVGSVTQTVLRLGLDRELLLPQVRLLEADDLEQAELMADIWQPDALIWDLPLGQVPRLSEHPKLLRLPIITLSEEISRAIHALGHTLVFPCLDLADLVAVVTLAATVKHE